MKKWKRGSKGTVKWKIGTGWMWAEDDRGALSGVGELSCRDMIGTSSTGSKISRVWWMLDNSQKNWPDERRAIAARQPLGSRAASTLSFVRRSHGVHPAPPPQLAFARHSSGTGRCRMNAVRTPDERRTNDSVLAARLPSGCRAAIARRSSGQFFVRILNSVIIKKINFKCWELPWKNLSTYNE